MVKDKIVVLSCRLSLELKNIPYRNRRRGNQQQNKPYSAIKAFHHKDATSLMYPFYKINAFEGTTGWLISRCVELTMRDDHNQIWVTDVAQAFSDYSI